MKQFATDAGLSEKYLSLVWSALTEGDADAGPLAVVRKKWDALGADVKLDAAKGQYVQLRDLTMKLRKTLKTTVPKVGVSGISDGSQAFILWRNRFAASRHRSYSGDVSADVKKLAEQVKGDDASTKLLTAEKPEAELRKGLERSATCSRVFFITDRSVGGISFDATKNRPLTAGFHLMQGYFTKTRAVLTDSHRQREARTRRGCGSNSTSSRSLEAAITRLHFFERYGRRVHEEAQFDFAQPRTRTTSVEDDEARRGVLAKVMKRKPGDDAVTAIRNTTRTFPPGAACGRRDSRRNRVTSLHF